jgi:ABC-type multidrug transport system ATPase subunit
VEQFDALSPYCTAKEAIAFSARLRLQNDLSATAFEKWVSSVIDMMELEPIQDRMVSTKATTC